MITNIIGIPKEEYDSELILILRAGEYDKHIVTVSRSGPGEYVVQIEVDGEWVEEEDCALHDQQSAIYLAYFMLDHGYAPEGSEHPFSMPE